MMQLRLVAQFAFAALLRYWLSNSKYKELLQDRIEISTPINSWKHLIEGTTLYNDGINPYEGDMFHENPLVLHVFNFFITNKSKIIQQSIPYLFILCDMLSALLLYFMSKAYMQQLCDLEDPKKQKFANNVSRLLVTQDNTSSIPKYVALCYLYNPFTILTCICFTTTVFSNLFLSLFFYAFVTYKPLLCSLAMALTLLQSIYPVTLLLPACIHFHKGGKSWKQFLVSFFAMYTSALYLCLFSVNFNLSFLTATYWFQLTAPNLRPNIGLFWYFFTEMFEHFRVLFLFAFQINSLLIYVFPLSIRLHKEPVLVSICLIGLAAVFRSYPCIGDVAFYLSLTPLLKHLFPFMKQGFVVVCFFIGCSIFAPTVWHLWIYTRSANANFYFGVSLAFSTCQIFLLTDLLFSYLKRDYTLQHGIKMFIRGRPAKLVLE